MIFLNADHIDLYLNAIAQEVVAEFGPRFDKAIATGEADQVQQVEDNMFEEIQNRIDQFCEENGIDKIDLGYTVLNKTEFDANAPTFDFGPPAS